MNATYPFLSVLAAGICGCARLHEKLGSSEASRAVDRCLKRIERAVEACGGRIVRIGSDEAMAAFDAADAAVHAAIEMQQRIADLPPVSGVKMAIRVGISCGRSSGSPAEDGFAREAARLVGVAKSGQILALGKIREALPETLRTLVSDTGLTLPNESGGSELIVEMALVEASAAPAAGSAGSRRDADSGHVTNGRLRLRYGGDTVVLDERRPVVDMGRDGACDLVIRDRRASRRHATIKRRGNLIVLVDRSTNGTYVTIDGDSEQFVKHRECTLYGRGVISFASSSAAPDADCVEFECI